MTVPLSVGKVETGELYLPDGHDVAIPLIRPTFSRWDGPPVEDDYGGKPVLDHDGEPLFAELAILRLLEEEGWEGVWVDTYRNRYLVDLPEKDGRVGLPPAHESILEEIHERNGGRSGCWDVFAWRNGHVLFAESKWKGKDAIWGSQREWLQAALAGQLTSKSFLVVEWELNDG